jgi:hypothetical protein
MRFPRTSMSRGSAVRVALLRMTSDRRSSRLPGRFKKATMVRILEHVAMDGRASEKVTFPARLNVVPHNVRFPESTWIRAVVSIMVDQGRKPGDCVRIIVPDSWTMIPGSACALGSDPRTVIVSLARRETYAPRRMSRVLSSKFCRVSPGLSGIKGSCPDRGAPVPGDAVTARPASMRRMRSLPVSTSM